jgi:hypothetical protein
MASCARAKRDHFVRTLYPGVLADFLYWLLREGKTADFVSQLQAVRQRLLPAVQGQPNADRLVNNFAMLGAAHALFAEYLGVHCPEVAAEARGFQEVDLLSLLQNMVGEVRTQRPIDVFWETLRELFLTKRVRVLGDHSHNELGRVIGKDKTLRSHAVYCLFPGPALEEVQKALQGQGREPLPLEAREIPRLLRREGKLVDAHGQPLPAKGGDTTVVQRQPEDSKPTRCFYVGSREFRESSESHDEQAPLQPDMPRNRPADAGRANAFQFDRTTTADSAAARP